MLKNRLIATMEKAENPLVIRATAWALEQATGVKTSDLIEQKSAVTASGSYRQGEYGPYDPTREGFYKLGALYGSGTGSYSGKTITLDAALESATVYACVKIIAEDVGRLPFFLYEKGKDGLLEKAYGNRLYRLLHDSPNPEMTAGSFREALTARALMGMDGFARIEKDSDGQVLALWPLITETVTLDRDSNKQRVYIVKAGSEKAKTYPQDQIFHLKGFTLDGDKGDAILQRARHTFGLTLSADEYAARFFSADSTPGVIMSVPAGVKYSPEKVKEIKAAWLDSHGGNGRRHGMAVMQDAVTLSRIDPDFQKLQLIESRKHQIAEICRLFRMQLHKVAELDRSTNNNIEYQGIEYTGHTLGPHLSRWEETVHLRLLTEEDKYHSDGRPRIYAEFSREAMQQGDFAAQVNGFTRLLQEGVFNIDEVRAWYNKNPVAGGHVHRTQMQMVDITKPIQSTTAGIAVGGGKNGN